MIGYGHKIITEKEKEIFKNYKITVEEAEQLLRDDLEGYIEEAKAMFDKRIAILGAFNSLP